MANTRSFGCGASRNGCVVNFQSLFFTKMALYGAQINGILASILIMGIDLPDPPPYARCPLSPVNPVTSVCFTCLRLLVGHRGLVKQGVEMSCWNKILIPKAPWPKLAARGGGGASRSRGCPRRVVPTSLHRSATGLPASTGQVPFV